MSTVFYLLCPGRSVPTFGICACIEDVANRLPRVMEYPSEGWRFVLGPYPWLEVDL